MCSTRAREAVVVFGRFTLFRDSPRLIANGLPVKVGARALELLIALVEANGRALGQAELARRGWPGLVVDVNTVQAQISDLRRALGSDRDLIVTVPGFGYRFAGELDAGPAIDAAMPGSTLISAPHDVPDTAPAREAAAASAVPAPASYTPQQLTPFVGRHAELSEVLGLVSITRAITLTGEPGIGKARVAREAARRLAPQFPDGVVPVMLYAHTPDDGFAEAFALALNAPPSAGRTARERVLERVRTLRALLVVDCSECSRTHAAQTIDALLAAGPELVVIATTRAPLGLRHEETVTLGPLRTPEQPGVCPVLAPAYDALRLLFARLAVLSAKRERLRDGARMPLGSALLTAFDAGAMPQAVVDYAVLVAQRLGGVPLALELAAAAIERNLTGDETLEAAMARYAQSLDFIDATGTQASRPAPIAAAFDLYLMRLTDRARRPLLRLAMFSGEFSHCSAIGLITACEPAMPPRDDASLRKHEELADDRLNELIEAGLVEQMARRQQWMLHIRLPLRDLLRKQLRDAGEFERTALALASGMPVRLNAHRKLGEQPRVDALDLSDLGDLRAALEWTLHAGRTEMAVALLESSASLWTLMSLEAEYLRRTRDVLARVEAVATPRRRDEMRLYTILSRALSAARAPVDEIATAWEAVYELANMCADSALREQALIGLIVCCTEAGDTARADELRERLAQLASDETGPGGAAPPVPAEGSANDVAEGIETDAAQRPRMPYL